MSRTESGIGVAGATLASTGDTQGSAAAAAQAARIRAGRRKMLLVALVCVLPVLGAYFAYFVMPPGGRTNYGELITPQRPAHGFALAALQDLDGSVAPASRIGQWRGKWLFVVGAPASCGQDCRDRLYKVRQVRLTTGKDRDRIERLWIVTGTGTPDAGLLAQHPGLHLARADAAAFAALFPGGSDGDSMRHIYLIDPLGNLMMRFPLDADPSLMKKDVAKLLKVSRIG